MSQRKHPLDGGGKTNMRTHNVRLQTNRTRAALALLVIFILSLAPALAAAQRNGASQDREDRSKIATDLLQTMDAGMTTRTPVIVTYAATPTARDVQKIRSRGALDRQLRSVNGLSARLSRKAIRDLSRDPRIASISPDRTVRGTMDVAYLSTGAAAAFTR